MIHTDPYWSIIVGTPIGMAETLWRPQILKFDMLEYLYRDTVWPWLKVIDAETWTQSDVYQSTTYMLVLWTQLSKTIYSIDLSLP